MSPNGGQALPVRYFCTAASGMERFLVDEVKKKLQAEEVCPLAGKVLFSSRAKVTSIVQLKSAERIFLLVKHDPPFTLAAQTNPGCAASALKSRLLADPEPWRTAAVTWRVLQRQLSGPHRKVTSLKEELLSWGEAQRLETCAEVRGVFRGEDDEPGRKRKRRDGLDNERNKKEKSSDKDSEHSAPGRLVGGCTEDSLELKASESEDQTPQQSDEVSFRISCKCSGALSRCLSVQEISRALGCGLSRALDWKVDLKNPQLEVSVYLSDDLCLLGIPLTRLPLASRSYMRTTGLRSTVAWAMGSLAAIQPGFWVIDPMCGVGTLLIEGAQEHQDVHFLGVDIDDGQLLKASENLAFADFGNRIHLLKASSMALPLSSCSVDAVICDLPFGRKFGTKTSMMADLPLILGEMERILRVGGRLVLLLTPQLSCLLKKLLTPQVSGPPSQLDPRGSWSVQDTEQATGLQPLSRLKHQETHRVSLGAIDGLIHTYLKTEPDL
ncbi:THUMP domain-containing protein 2 [Synchiropus splendidus]|uniref:THUMP domain-containing protein 2 n=1 Tax=Synchiropus splendidus TaxID=270530 RepID=UPI00237DEDF5|nr:THUMP domain-containing protein 2 [Synchiropus splendidus]